MTSSTAETEFVSDAAGGVEILRVEELTLEIGMQAKTPGVLRIENKASIRKIDNEVASANRKVLTSSLFSARIRCKRQDEDFFAETKATVADY